MKIQSLIIGEKLSNGWLLLSCLICIICYIIFYTLAVAQCDIIIKYQIFTINIITVIFACVYLIILCIICFNYNYQIVLYQLKSFETWWILFDSMILIDKKFGQYEWQNLNNFKNYQNWTSYYLTFISYVIICIFIPLGVTMLQALFSIFPTISKQWINIVIIILICSWLKWGIESVLTPNKNDVYVIIIGNDIDYGVSLNHIVFLKTIDLAVCGLLSIVI